MKRSSLFLSLATGAVVGALTLATLTSFRPHWTFDPLAALPSPLIPLASKLVGLNLLPDRGPAGAALVAPSHRGHSHNDFARALPLEDALENRFASVEADVHLRNGQVWVSHLGVMWAGTLRDLYLEPLRKRVAELGSVRGDGREFLLWIDVKTGTSEMVGALQDLLSKYPMLTRYEEGRRIAGAVSVIFTGNGYAKRHLVRDFGVRYGCRDNLRFSETDPVGNASEWCWYSINWFDEFEWDGEGEMSETERAHLRRLVRRAHSKGRKLRFWGNPDTPSCWREIESAGTDLVGTDAVRRFSGYF